jgi:L-fuculose-phosphate aldolase
VSKPDAPSFEAVREEVAAAARRLAAHGLVIGTAGNLSVGVADLVAVTATGAAFETMTTDQVSVVDADGTLVHGELAPTSELGLHLAVHRRFGATAVVHTHSPMATAVGLVAGELPCVHYQMLQLGGAIPVAEYATFGTPELAEAVLAVLAGKSAALMANHGAITHGASLSDAVEKALLLEWACTLYWRASAIGTPRVLDADAQLAVLAAAARLRYGTTRPVTKESR